LIITSLIHDVRGHPREEQHQLAAVLGLDHLRAVLGGDRHRALVEDRRGDLAGAHRGCADAVDALLDG